MNGKSVDYRYKLVALWLGSLLAGWLVLRLVFFFAFYSAPLLSFATLAAFIAGLYRDLYVAGILTLPLIAWLTLRRPKSPASGWCSVLFWTACGLFWFNSIFLLFVEFFFFDEFKSRFNTVAVDYLIYPHEVFINIWESYHVGWFLVICALVSAGWVYGARKLTATPSPEPASGRKKAPVLFTIIVLAVMTLTIRLRPPHVSNDRTLNEIANNGAISFVAAAWTHHLDYAAFYRTLPREEAYQRARKLLADSKSTFTEPGFSIQRAIAGDVSRPRLNVVIVLEESLGSEFWGSLGRKGPSLTPEMDRIALQEGLLFTNIYACGNRTVRGMEGVLSSFPPLPGDSIVKRDKSDHVETIARVLQRDGYRTLFLYGGRGVFDSMRSFAVRNGYERFIEQKHFANPTFTTIWGVCDEDLFKRTIEECRALALTGKPFLATVLSVSNHKPYTYPAGRIREDPNDRKRENAVKYSDYSLGQFFKMAKGESFWTNTIFVVVADHGARVYGNQSIPIHSYEIPLVITGPAVVKSASQIGMLGNSLDVSPTILGMIGRPYQTIFFGHDLLNCGDGQTRALLNHNRDIGMLRGERMCVLGLMQSVEFYAGNPKHQEMKLEKQPVPEDENLEADTTALYQVADELYTGERYRISLTNSPVASAPPLASPGSGSAAPPKSKQQ